MNLYLLKHTLMIHVHLKLRNWSIKSLKVLKGFSCSKYLYVNNFMQQLAYWPYFYINHDNIQIYILYIHDIHRLSFRSPTIKNALYVEQILLINNQNVKSLLFYLLTQVKILSPYLLFFFIATYLYMTCTKYMIQCDYLHDY